MNIRESFGRAMDAVSDLIADLDMAGLDTEASPESQEMVTDAQKGAEAAYWVLEQAAALYDSGGPVQAQEMPA